MVEESPNGMEKALGTWIRRVLVVATAVGGAYVVHLTRGSNSTLAEPLAPQAPAKETERRHGATPSQNGVLGVALRLVDLLDEAAYDAPDIARAEGLLSGYWRKMPSPYAARRGSQSKLVQQLALVRQAGPEAVFGAGEKAWRPDPRVWDMTLGSVEQREAIHAPPPASIRYRIAVPAGAIFEAAPATLLTSATVTFQVAVTLAGGERRVLAARALQPGQRRWVDWRVDLSAFGGQNVELELSTQARPGEDGKPPPAAPAFWGSPVVLAPAAASLPFNIVFFVVDALRGDAVAGLHDPKLDAQMARAPHPPLDAWLPKLEGLTPNLDALAGRGVSFARASSASTWTRPGTIAMLTGARSGSLGLSPREMIPSIKEVQQFYALKPPFLPRLLRTRGAVTRAFVNNFYLVGYAGVGVDIGFEGMIDHRHPTNDTEWITQDTLTWLRENKNQRFALFVNYGSPHSPYEPPAADLQAVPPSPVGPSNATVRAYLGEIHKDDTAIGRVVAELDALGLREDTLVIVTADHGETLSVEHESIPLGLMRDPPSGRFHHLLCIWDETVRVPIILSYPKRLPQGVLITEPVQTTDIVPTVIDLAQMERPAATQGRSLVPLAQGKPAVAQPIIVEGRGAWAIRDGRYRLIVRERAYQRLRTIHGERTVALELYDLENDPGERDEISSAHPDIVQRLKSKLESHLNAQARRDQPISSSQSGAHPIIRLRFVTAGTRHRASGSLEASPPPGEHRAVLKARGVRLDARALRERGGGWDFDFSTEPDRSVGFDLEVDPPTADVKWRLLVDGRPWPAERVYAGSFGLRAETLAGGVVGEPMRTIAAAELTPLVDPKRDWGLFVTRDSIAHEVELTREGASQETLRLMHAWGYAADEVESDDAAAPAAR